MKDAKRLRDAVVRNDREVEVTPDGTVLFPDEAPASDDKPERDAPPKATKRKATKLSDHVFG